VTRGTFPRQATLGSSTANENLVKNADDNWPTASAAYPEVIAAGPLRNRDDSRESLAE
jgi:hypothetical protein